MDLPRDLPDGPTADNVIPLRPPASTAAIAISLLRQGGALRNHAAQAVAAAIGRRGARSGSARARLALAPEPAGIAGVGDPPAPATAQGDAVPTRATEDAQASFAEPAPAALADALDTLPAGPLMTATSATMRWSSLSWHYRARPRGGIFRVF